MHPLIKEYLNTNTPTIELLEKYHNKDQFLESVFLEVAKTSLYKYDNMIYHKIDQAIIKGHPDQDIYLLFILSCILLTSSHFLLENANSLQSIAASLLQENTHPIFRAIYMQSISRIKHFENKTNECIHLMQAAVKLIDDNCPRYRTILSNYAAMLATEGRLNELSEIEVKVFNSPSNDFLKLVRIEAMVTNCIITGNHVDGFDLFKDYQSLFKGDRVYKIQGSMNLLKILSGDLNAANYDDELFKLIVNVFHFLSIRNVDEAIKYHKLFLSKNDGKSMAGMLYENISINFELCLGNIESARKLLDDKKVSGTLHYLDDLFFARLQLLENNTSGAHRSMAKLLESVDEYGALNRIKFELQFATELKSIDLFILMKEWKNPNIYTEVKLNKLPTVGIKAKGIKLIVGKSSAINQIKTLIKKYAPLKEIILITGETGTGKELVAKALHEESRFSNEPFIAINCGALTDTLLESELFGYEAGSFTGAVKQKKGIFESAGKGMVFLDEFGDISPKLQVSLLRVLESNEIRMIGGSSTRKVECRILVATNIDLKKAVETKKFREDLYFRLARFDIGLPPLRKRASDIPELVNYFLEGSQGATGVAKIASAELLKTMENYQWPGNIRELKNCIDRLKILNPEKDILNIEDLNFIQFQGEISIPKNTESQNILKNTVIESPETKPAMILNDDPIFNIIMQKGFKSEQRVMYLKQLFQKYKILSRGQVTEIAKVNPITATKDLQKLCDEGFIVKKTPTKSYRSNYYEIAL